MRRVLLLALLLGCAFAASGIASGFSRGTPCPKFSKKYLTVLARGESGCNPRLERCWYTEPITFEVQGFGYDLDCRNHSYEWTFSDGTRATGRKVTHRWSFPREVERATVVVRERWSSARIHTDVRFLVAVP